MRILSSDQRTPDWFAARVGFLTASRAADMMASIKSGEAAARRDLRTQIVCERLTGQAQEDAFVSKDMQRGTDLEPVAFAAYEAETGCVAHKVGFLAHDTLQVGCSPDGVIDDFEGLVELKVPKSATHLKYLKLGRVPPEYLPQITLQLWITGAQWCDFVSFDDRFPIDLQLFCVRVPRETLDFPAMELLVRLFLGEVEKELAGLLPKGAAA